MSFTYSVNTDGTVSNVQFEKTEQYGDNITCAEDVVDDLQYQSALYTFLERHPSGEVGLFD